MIRPDTHPGTGLAPGQFRHLGDGLDDIAVGKSHAVGGAIAPDDQFKTPRERVGDRHANAMQPAGEGVGAPAFLVELSAGVQTGENKFGNRCAFLGVQAHRDSATVVLDGDAAVGVHGDLDLPAESRERLVGRVIDDFLHDMQGIFGTGIHTGALAHRLESLEDPDRRFVIGLIAQVIPNCCGKDASFYEKCSQCCGARWIDHKMSIRRARKYNPGEGCYAVINAAGVCPPAHLPPGRNARSDVGPESGRQFIPIHENTMSDNIKNVSDAAFEADVLKSSKPVLVDYWAAWCGPCKMIAPILEEVAKEYGDKVMIAKLNVDENPETAAKFGIRGIPTLMLFKDGQVAQTKVGAMSKSQLTAFLDSAI